jgi:predicted O-methyltransferase YrrM
MIPFKNCPVPILQNEWEFSILYDLFFKLDPKNILEIGTFFGGTLWYWLNEGFRDTVCVIDLPITHNDQRYFKMVECKKLWTSWLDNVTDFIPIYADSKDFQTISSAQNIFHENNKIDFLLIDGGHDEETVLKDYLNYSHLVRKDGMIVFHDIVWEKGVSTVWNYIKADKRHIEIRKEFGIGIIYKD